MENIKQASLLNVARYTVLRLQQMGVSISPLKLQKILYYIQAWHLVYFEKQSLFPDEPEAWVNGPVYRDVYEEYRTLGIYQQITPAFFELTDESVSCELEKLHDEMALNNMQWAFIEAIYKHYGTMDHDRLVMLTHSEKPWNEARKGLSPLEYSDNKISLDSMYDYYYSLLNKK